MRGLKADQIRESETKLLKARFSIFYCKKEKKFKLMSIGRVNLPIACLPV